MVALKRETIRPWRNVNRVFHTVFIPDNVAPPQVWILPLKGPQKRPLDLLLILEIPPTPDAQHSPPHNNNLLEY